MAINKEQQSRAIIYFIIVLIIGIGVFLYYLGSRDDRFSLKESDNIVNQSNTNKYAGITVEPNTVTSSPKFISLQPVIMPSDYQKDGTTSTVTSTTDSRLTPEQLNRIVRRHRDPFAPF